MAEFVRDPILDIQYATCIYSGILNSIDFEIEHGFTDMRKELLYMVERYCNEEMVPGKYLREKLEKYNKIAEERYGKE